MKNRILCDRYKKLKQSDRMEFLAINNIYENKSNTYDIILLLALSIKMIIAAFLMIFIFSLFNMSEEISTEKVVNVMIEMPFGEGVSLISTSFLASLSLMFVEIVALFLSFHNMREWRKGLDEFLDEHSLKQ